MTTEYHDEAGEGDESSFWNKDSRRNRSHVFSMRWSVREVLLPVIAAVVILSIIVSLAVVNARTGSRLSALEETLSHANKTLTSSMTMSQGALKETHRMQFAVENNKDQLASVAEALTRLSVLDTMSKTVSHLKCSMERFIHNRTVVAGCCPLGWETRENTCYYYSTVEKSWQDARDWCSNQEGQLVVMNTPEEWDYITNRIGHGHYYWVGLSDERTGKWEWVNHTPYTMNRRHWMPNQPDNWTGHGLDGTEDCAHFDSHFHKLNDIHCTTRMRFICQKHSN